MHSYSQTRTPQGFLPFGGVSVAAPCCCGSRFDGSLVFSLRPPEECAAAELSGAGVFRPAPGRGVVDLGLCMQSVEAPSGDGRSVRRSWSPDVEALAEFARGSGPLFGSADGRESLRDWAAAADAAFVASRVQECVNGAKGVRTLAALDAVEVDVSSGGVLGRDRRIQKTRVASRGAAEGLTVFSLGIAAPGRYRDCLAGLPLAQRVGLLGGSYLYAFAQEEQGGAVGFYAVSLPHEISSGEFALLVEAFGLAGETEGVLREKMRIADDGAAPLVSDAGNYEDAEEALADGDREALGALVRMMILAHLGGARVDPFQDDPVTGNHSFDSLLGWMWYGFSVGLSSVKVGYCRKCGRPFSLVGSRGIQKQYCSEACKDASKNERSRNKRDAVRRAFLAEGADVGAIAERVYGSDSRLNRASVRSDLEKWVKLKHALADEAESLGLGGSPLIRRCEENGLDVEAMLPARLALEYRRLSSEK